MKPEIKNCQNCKKNFQIEAEDFDFYSKIKVPPPTFCPECRLQRRLIWMKGLELFKRKCDLCGEMKISMYHPDAPYVVYCDRCWWSDNWDARDFSKTYDPNRSFLEQWNDLLHATPILGLSIDKMTGERSPFTNHVGNSKGCYLIFYSNYVEDSAYSYQLTHAKDVYNSGTVLESEYIFDSSHVFRSYNIFGGIGNNRMSSNCFFIRDCEDCHNCFGLSSARNKSYVFLGEQLSKEEYFYRLNQIDLGSYKQYKSWKEKVENYFKIISPRPTWDTLSRNVTGSYVFQSRNCQDCYDVTDCEDSKFLMLIKLGKVNDAYDYVDWGENVEKIYECMTVGADSSNIRFTHESGFGLYNIEYSKLSTGGSHHFGCVSMKKSEYCILNKQYSKAEYEKLRDQIITDMNSNPYISTAGHSYKYGEFFPPEFSPHFYNDTFASRFFHLSKNEVTEKGLKWFDGEKREYTISMESADIPDNIKDVNDSILNEVLQCNNCVRGYKIIPQELQFLQKHNLPLPRQCPFCRIWEKVDTWIENMTLHKRTCDKCKVNFKTHYDENRAPRVLCKECYRKEYI